MKKEILLYTRFERFWHWSQAALIMALLVTGFEIHGSYRWLGFENAVGWHRILAWSLIGLWAFAIFWHLTTGQWRHYIPTTEKLVAVVRYYAVGIFRGESHPYRKTSAAKHNPLQRLAYLAFKLAISPLLWISGLLYLYYASWRTLGPAGLDLEIVALVHTTAAFAMLVFFIGHVYMTTTGKPPLRYIRGMLTGRETVEE